MSISNEYDTLKNKPFNELSARHRILKTASDLFYRFGIQAVGIDRIIEESDVSKRTFYNHFNSKNILISEYFKYRRSLWTSFLIEATGDENIAPDQRILNLFDELEKFMGSSEFFGCPFQKGMAEFGQADNIEIIKDQIDLHYESVFNFIHDLVKKTSTKKAKKVTEAIISLIEGSVVLSYANRDAKIVKTNKEAARLILMHSK